MDSKNKTLNERLSTISCTQRTLRARQITPTRRGKKYGAGEIGEVAASENGTIGEASGSCRRVEGDSRESGGCRGRFWVVVVVVVVVVAVVARTRTVGQGWRK
ncbi:hypothetical protein EX30DRAFT_341953 [Ascodesmis nigricans]|uniref:Uncharacterized protein n=1 Tax=Ascodesmis nigricans TaxID=341454 RepID=A0A4S2MTP0_9PEZI|nr:hypothetical protein EX30DRAFT_341953 [Ascodesmis nigricans]